MKMFRKFGNSLITQIPCTIYIVDLIFVQWRFFYNVVLCMYKWDLYAMVTFVRTVGM